MDEMDRTYGKFQSTLAPRDVHNSREKRNHARDSGVEVLARETMRAQSSHNLQRDVTPHRMPHQNNSNILNSLLFHLFNKLNDIVFRVANLVLQSIRRVFAILVRFDILG